MVNRRSFFLIILCVLVFWSNQAVIAEQLIDPMRPANYRAQQSPGPVEKDEIDTSSWKLTAVLTSFKRQVAVVNGRCLQQGDSLEGFTVRKIQKDRVFMQNGTKKVVLRRTGTGFKKDIR